MLGTSGRNPYIGETNGAGVMGPRGCAPLAWAPPSRIARAVSDWKTPVTTQFTLTTTPVQVARLNANRALLVLCFDMPNGSAQAGQAGVCVNQADCRATIPVIIFGMAWPNGGNVKLTHRLSYSQEGSLTVNEWWAVATVNQGCRLNVLEQEFYG